MSNIGDAIMGKPVPDLTIPCGGCGATKDSERCIGCLHDFGTPESAELIESFFES